jgi:hypothetical protein
MRGLRPADADDQASGCGAGDPARGVRRARGQWLRKFRERDHARGTLGSFEAAENLRLLGDQPLSGKVSIRFRGGVDAHALEPCGEFAEPRAARPTGSEVRVR